MVRVIENFSKAPLSKRKEALTANYVTIQHDGVKYPTMCEVEDKESFKFIEFELDKEFKFKKTIYRKYQFNDEQPTYIHNDSYISDMSAILFLNQDGTPEDGLAFWQHERYGWKKATKFHFTEEEFGEFFDDQYDESKWFLWKFIPMKFNRLVVFDSNLYHSRYPMKKFGEERLIQTFFMK